MQASALVPESFAATVQGASPGFVNRAQGDFHLNSASACRDHGLNTLVFVDGEGLSHPGAPTEECVAPTRRRARQNDGRLDIGAFESFLPVINGIQVRGRDCLLAFSTAEGSLYDLERSTDIAQKLWFLVAAQLAGVSNVILVTDTNVVDQPHSFYRVRVSM
jgi:hypothetical protein